MRKTAFLAVLLLTLAACSAGDTESTTTSTFVVVQSTANQQPITTTTTDTMESEFPATVEADNGTIIVQDRPETIVSLSSVATEMLFEIGAGPQIAAVDDQSNYPSDAPMTDLSGFTPNVEAILAFDPDLVVISFDPGDLIAGLESAGVEVISYGTAASVDDIYRQIQGLGTATGNYDVAVKVNEQIRTDLDDIVAGSVSSGEGVTYYHEIDNSFYAVTSSTYIGEVYSMFGMLNIADAADESGSAFGYPQLSSEYIVASDPNIILLANVLYGENKETVSSRPGWNAMSAVQKGDIAELDSDVASRWGPRIVDFARSIADALRVYHGG